MKSIAEARRSAATQYQEKLLRGPRTAAMGSKILESGKISEPDWILLQGLCRTALERYCEQSLEEIKRLVSEAGRSPHQCFLQIAHLVQQQEEEFDRTFGDLRRSTAVWRLAAFCARGLVSETELQLFSDETRDVMGSIQSVGRG